MDEKQEMTTEQKLLMALALTNKMICRFQEQLSLKEATLHAQVHILTEEMMVIVPPPTQEAFEEFRKRLRSLPPMDKVVSDKFLPEELN